MAYHRACAEGASAPSDRRESCRAAVFPKKLSGVDFGARAAWTPGVDAGCDVLSGRRESGTTP